MKNKKLSPTSLFTPKSLCLLLPLLLCSCRVQRIYTAPSWVFQIPQDKDYIYVVGSSGKSLRPWDSKELAIEDAFVKLAQLVGTQIFMHSKKLIEEGKVTSQAAVIKNRTNAALKNASIVEFWADPKGAAGKDYRVYVLMRLKKSFLQ
ncbi:MAG: hypothetical protein D6805_03770 [Planctomycetota bacterium]|nr:MAG: hypothetical protein D6805_03770 [Planctomycetota bacterium]